MKPSAPRTMPRYKGFAQLREASDLLMKLQHDLVRMTDDPSDDYAAFNFFVTAEHLVDWLHPDQEQKAQRKALRENEPLLRIVSHIANGLKHFRADAPRHGSVLAIDREVYAEDGYFAEDYVEEPIVIQLTHEEGRHLGFEHIDAVVLADQVVAYWQNKPGVGVTRGSGVHDQAGTPADTE